MNPHSSATSDKFIFRRERVEFPDVAKEYYPWFDWLRAVCACTVMFAHSGMFSWHRAGNFAVQVFFALSGWLIGSMLLKIDRTDLPRFYFNRAIRIWVPYYLAAGLLLTFSALREPITSKWIEIVIYKLTFVYNIFGTPQLAEFKNSMPQKGTLNHFWSVNAEEQFYLLAPFLLVLTAKRYGRSLILWSALAIVTLASDTYAAIVFGVLSAIVTAKYGSVHLSFFGRNVIAAFLLVISPSLFYDWAYVYTAPLIAILIVLILAVPSPQHRLGAIFGGMSYPLYLNHWIGGFTFNFLMPSLKGSLINQLLAGVMNIIVAIALYQWIDKRLLNKRAEWFTIQRGWQVMFLAFGLVLVGLFYGL